MRVYFFEFCVGWICIVCSSVSLAGSPDASILSSVSISISGESSAFVFHEFKKVSEKAGMHCSYKVRTDLFADPAPVLPKSLICGPTNADLLIMSKNANPKEISIDVDWLIESCKSTNPYTGKQLQTMAEKVIADLRKALSGDRHVAEFAVMKDDLANAECPQPLPQPLN